MKPVELVKKIYITMIFALTTDKKKCRTYDWKNIFVACIEILFYNCY